MSRGFMLLAYMGYRKSLHDYLLHWKNNIYWSSPFYPLNSSPKPHQTDYQKLYRIRFCENNKYKSCQNISKGTAKNCSWQPNHQWALHMKTLESDVLSLTYQILPWSYARETMTLHQNPSALVIGKGQKTSTQGRTFLANNYFISGLLSLVLKGDVQNTFEGGSLG